MSNIVYLLYIEGNQIQIETVSQLEVAIIQKELVHSSAYCPAHKYTIKTFFQMTLNKVETCTEF